MVDGLSSVLVSNLMKKAAGFLSTYTVLLSWLGVLFSKVCSLFYFPQFSTEDVETSPQINFDNLKVAPS